MARAKGAQARVENDIMASAMDRVNDEQVIEGPDRPPVARPPVVKKRPANFPKKASIAYVPLEDGDLAFTVWYGMKFRANVPREVTNQDMIESAMTNPWFSVDGKPPFKRAKPLGPRDTSEDVQAMEFDDKKQKEVELEDIVDGDADAG